MSSLANLKGVFVKHITPIIAVTMLMGCATNPTATSSTVSGSEMPTAIKAFTDICLKTAPSFSGAAKEASAYGVTEITDAGFMKMGFNQDQSLGVQIKENKECAITTPNQRDQSLTKKFTQAVGQHTGAPAAKSAPFKGKIGNEVFIFQHDRQGGEAFVMLNIKG